MGGGGTGVLVGGGGTGVLVGRGVGVRVGLGVRVGVGVFVGVGVGVMYFAKISSSLAAARLVSLTAMVCAIR